MWGEGSGGGHYLKYWVGGRYGNVWWSMFPSLKAVNVNGYPMIPPSIASDFHYSLLLLLGRTLPQECRSNTRKFNDLQRIAEDFELILSAPHSTTPGFHAASSDVFKQVNY